MSRVKIKEFTQMTGEKESSSRLGEMCGSQDAETEIIIPRWVNVGNTIRRCC